MQTNEPATSTRWIHPSVLVGVAAVALTVFGWLVLFSSTLGYREDSYFFIKRQLIWSGIAFVVGFIAYTVNLESIRRLIWVAVAVAVVFQVAVLIPGIGIEVNGARRWIDLGFMRMQVSELAKLGIIFGLAHYLGTYTRHISTFWKGFVLPFGLLGLFCGLIILQPDFGTTAVCGVVGASMLFVAGVRWRFLIPTALMAVAAFALMVWQDPIRLRRITTFIDVEAHRADGTYQLWQGMLAFVSGGLWGVGPGQGRQQMSYLPEAHTDFIFSMVGEEYGLIATMGVLVSFLVIFMVMVRNLSRCANLYQSMLLLGCGMFVTLQAVINVGVVTGCLPTKGLSLPFISYGGSNLLLMFFLTGIMMNILKTPATIPWKRKGRGLEELTG